MPKKDFVNPLFAVDQDEVAAAAEEARKLSDQDLRNAIQKQNHDLKLIFSEMQTADGGYDYNRITSIKGSAGDKTAAIIKAASVLNGHRHEYNRRQEVNKLAERGVADDPFAPEFANDRIDVTGTADRFTGIFDAMDNSIDGGIMQMFNTNGAAEMTFGPDHPIFGALFQEGDLSGGNNGASYQPALQVAPRLVETATQPPTMMSIIPMFVTDQGRYIYNEETMHTKAAEGARAEGAAATEATLRVVQRSVDIESVAVQLPATLEQLADVRQARRYIERRLPNLVRLDAEKYMVRGTGTSPQPRGITEFSGINNVAVTVTSGKVADPIAPIASAENMIEEGAFDFPDYVTLHPRYWNSIRTTKGTDGHYLYGSPADAMRPAVFGVPVVRSNWYSIAASGVVGVVGNFGTHSDLIIRENIRTEMGTQNDDLGKLQRTFVTSMRMGVAVYRPKAFTTLTLSGAFTG